MLSELLLCGIASMDLGLKTATANKSPQEKDILLNEASINEVVGDSESELINTKSFYDVQSNLSSQTNTNKIWVNEYIEEDKYNDKFSYSQIISPAFESVEEFEDLEGFNTKVSGTLSNKQDVDFYTFYLYGDASVKIELGFSPEASKAVLYKVSTKNGELGLSEVMTSYPCQKSDGINYKGIEASLRAGTYCIAVKDSQSTNSEYYSITVEAKYNTQETGIESLNILASDYEIGSVAWISDFDPFESPAFKQCPVTISNNLSSRNTLEGKLQNFDKILHSSLFVHGNTARIQYYNFFNDFREQILKKLEDLNADKIKFENLSTGFRIAESIISIAFSIATLGTSKIIKESVDLALTWATETYNMADQTLNLATGGRGNLCLSSLFESMIPTEQMMSYENFKQYLESICSHLNPSLTEDPNHGTIRIDSYYKISQNDKNELELCFDNSELWKDIKYDSDSVSLDDLPNRYFKGKFYKLKNVPDFTDAQNHIQHQFNMIPPECVPVTNFGTGIDNGIVVSTPSELWQNEYKWYRFTAEDAGTYQFTSNGNYNFNETDTLVGEIYDKVYVGRNLDVTPISYDEDDGTAGNFLIWTYLEAGETVYIRVHGKNWKTLKTQFSMNVAVVNGQSIGYTIPKDTPYYENDIPFPNGDNRWKIVKFESSGNKVFQNYSNDNRVSMKLCDSRGAVIADTNGQCNGLYNNGFFSTYVYSDQLYFLNLRAPSYGGTDKSIKISIISSNDCYTTINDIEQYDKHDYNCDITYILNKGEAALALFTPDLTAHYYFDSNIGTNIEIYDTYSGTRMTKFYKESNYYHDSIACLDENHEYLLVIYYEDFENDSGRFEICFYYYEDDEIVIPQPPVLMDNSHVSFEKQFKVKSNSTWDYWISFNDTGYSKNYRIFQVFGLCKDIVIELYDLRNNILASDDTSKGNGTFCFFCYEVNDGEPYRVRIKNNKNNSSTATLKLSITYSYDYYEDFNSVQKLNWKEYPDFSNENIWDEVAYFVAPENGCFEFIGQDGCYPRTTDIYVVDVSSKDLITFKNDCGLGDDNFFANGTSPAGRLYKNLIKGHIYFIHVVPGDGPGTSTVVSTSRFGTELANACENGGYSNWLQIDAGSNTKTFNTVYKASKTGFVCFDAAVENPNLANDVNITISNKFGKEINAVVGNMPVNGKDRLFAWLEEGQTYLVEITKVGYSSVKNDLRIIVCYSYASSFEEENITIPSNGDGRYYEKVCTLYGEQEKHYYVTFQTGGMKTFQTFGNLDTEITLYSQQTINGRRIIGSDDNSGYENNAFFSYSVEANVEYLLVVRLHGSSQYGQVKTTITPYNRIPTSFEFFSKYNVSGSFSVSYSLEKNYSQIILIKPSSSGTYTITLSNATYNSTKIDTYLYVLDPSSSASKQSSVDYNDDISSSDRNSRITRTLEQNKTYFVVMSAFNITSSSGVVTLNISRNY